MSTPFTAVHETPNRSPRQNVPRKGVVLHHAAMTSLSGLRSLAMGAKEVSATAICKDDDLELMVPDDGDRPWSLASAWGDSSFRSVETCNESTDGWTISDKSHWSLARAVAYWAKRDGFYPHRNGPRDTWTVLGHREVADIYDISYGTACPGGMDLDLVTRRAQSLLGSSPAGETPTIIEEPEEGDMAKIIMRNTKKREWALVGPNGDASGCRTTQVQTTANAWARIYGPATVLEEWEYKIVIAEARAIAATQR